jgi:hypothetical protein
MNLALDFFGLRWCSGYTIFSAIAPSTFNVFIISAHAPVNDNKNEAQFFVSLVLSNRHQKLYFGAGWLR